MIGKLKGIVDTIALEYVILDVNGVGYKVFCSSKLLDTLNTSENLSLLIETIVKEDSITLYGFSKQEEQDCFNMLCKVSGVGPKMALKVMSINDVNEIITAITTDNKDIFCRVSGIGSKVALRIVNELKSLVKNFGNVTLVNTAELSMPNNFDFVKDAVSALEGLGYQKNHVLPIVQNIVKERPDLTLESIITESLKKINGF